MSTPYYRDIGNEREIFRHAYNNQLPLLLKGPTGCGKSRFIEAMAAELARPLITVSCHDDTSATDLLGRFLVRGGDTIWQDGPLTRALRENAILYLDEIAEAREDVVVVIHPLTDHRREIYVERVNEQLKAAPEFMLVASFNPGYQRRVKELKPSTRQRFVGMTFGYPQPDVESEIITRETGIGSDMASQLASFGKRIRGLEELGLTESVSTRLLVYAAKCIRAGISPRQACNVAIAQPLTDDAAIQLSINDLAALIF